MRWTGGAFRVAALLLAALMALPAIADDALLAPRPDSIQSKILDQRRDIAVYLPEESADDPKARFETIYVLDGDWNARIVVDIVDFMRQVGFMPPVIVVSVPNYIDADGINSRDHDLTPTVSPEQDRSGGAAQFLAFLKTELIPYVESHYPANGIRSIHGHSYGGLFLFYVLMNDPSLFGGYILVDPAMGWDHHMFDAIAEAKLPAIDGKDKAIYVAARTGQPYERMGMAGLKPIFERRAPADLHWAITTYADETHDSLKLKGTYDAFRFVFEGYTQGDIDFVPARGTLIKGRPFALHAHNVNERLDIRYATDGSEPNGSSPKFGEFVSIEDAAKTRIRLISNRGVYDRDLPHHLVDGSAWRPSSRSIEKRDDRWHAALYPLDAWPSLRRAQPIAKNDMAQMRDLPASPRDAYSMSITRDLVVDADAYYVFYVKSSDQARLSIAGTKAIEVDGSQDDDEETIVEPLRRGTYELRIDARHPDPDDDADLRVYRDESDGEWWKHEVLRLSNEHRR